MIETIIDFLFDIPANLAPFFNWLLTPINGLGIAPLGLFGIAGFLVVLAFHIVHLVNPMG